MIEIKQRWRRLFVGCVIMIALGFIYGWSVFSQPLAEDFGWDPATLSFTFTVLMWAFCAGGIIGARVSTALSVRMAVGIAAAAILLAFVVTALFLSAHRPWIMYLAYGLIGGCGVGMAYSVTMGASIAWFPDRSGLASGVMLLCYSVSTLVLSSIALSLFSLFGWRFSFIVLAVGIAIIIAVLARTLRMPSAEEVEAVTRSLARSDSAATRRAMIGKSHRASSLSTAEMLRSPAFYLYACWMLTICSVGLAITGSSNQLALATGAETAAAVAIVGLLSICNGFGRLLTGLLYDAVGLMASMLIVAGAHIAGCALILGGVILHSPALMVAAAVIGGAGIGGSSVIGSSFTASLFGGAHYAQNLSTLNLVLIPAALIGPTIISLSASWTGSYAPGLQVLIGFGAASIALSGVLGYAVRQLSLHRKRAD